MLNIVTIWTPSRVFTADYVNILYASVKRNITHPARFFCLTDADVEHQFMLHHGIHVLHAESGWHGWWLSIELFAPMMFDGPVVYMDLDTFITGNIDFLADDYDGILMGLNDFYHPGTFANGVMKFNPCPALEAIYSFLREPHNYREANKLTFKDMEYTGKRLKAGGIKYDRWQDKYPGKIISYKTEYKKGHSLDGVSIVCCHGLPKPHEIHDAPLREHWRL